MDTLARLFRPLRPYPWRVAALITLTAALTVTSLLIPGVIRDVIDNGLSARNSVALVQSALFILGLGVARFGLAFGRRYLGEWLVNRTGFDLRNALYDKIQRLDFGFHDLSQTGQLMSRCTEDVSAVSRFIGQGAIEMLNVTLLLVGILIVMLSENATLTAIGLIPLAALTALTLHLGRIAESMFLRVDQALGAVSSYIQEYATGVQMVRAFAREQDENQRFDIPHRALYDARVRIVRTWGTYLPTMFVLVMGATLLILWFGGLMVPGTLTLGQIVAFNAYLLLLGGPVQELGFVVTSASEAAAGATRIYEILDRKPVIENAPGAAVLSSVTGRVTFEGVSFAYRMLTADGGPQTAPELQVGRSAVGGPPSAVNFAGSTKPVMTLHDINFTAEPNQVVVLIGPTGSGKSSVVSLIPRFYDPTAGRVLIDGKDIRQVTLDSLRKQIGLVLQSSLLFSASVKENIAYGRPEASDDEVIAAAKVAQAHEFILRLPQGYETVVGERGVTLSGGQRQRVAIARALLTDPRILILDDATSSVDTRTEHLIQQALDTLMQGRTTFVIAQRLSTVKRADQILVLDAGRIVQRGTHAELVAQPGLYRDIYDLQLRDQERVRREMLFVDSEERELPRIPKPKAERPDPTKPEQGPLRPSSVK